MQLPTAGTHFGGIVMLFTICLERGTAKSMHPTIIALLLLAFLQTAPSSPSGGQSEIALSPAETAAINHQIASLHSAADRGVANEWSDAKKVAEIICRPAALPVLKKQLPGTDRVFLGTEDPKTLTLESNVKLTGTGSARATAGWQDFTFNCEIDPKTAKVTSFVPVLTTQPVNGTPHP
jgi:hypothetical protein